MPRCIALTVLLLLSAATVAPAEEEGDRVERLERALEEQGRRYEERIGELERRLREREAADGKVGVSELDRLLEEAAKEADRAFEDGTVSSTMAAGPSRPNAFNPRITVFGDFVARLDSRAVSGGHGDEHEEEEGGEHEEERQDDRAFLRSLELDFRADIDPYAKGVAILGLHEHAPGEYEIDAEEVYFTLETLPYHLRAKVGKFLASMGVFNRLHPHDYPFTTRPLVLAEWFGEEGLAAQGTEVSWLVPQSWVDSLQLTAGLYSGELEPLGGGESHDPGFLGRLQLFETLSDASFFQVGTSHLVGFTDPDGDRKAWIAGLDLLYRWRPLKRATETSFVLQAELYRSRRESEAGTTESLGGFAFLQFQPLRNLYLGTRFDWVEPLDRFESETGRAWAAGLWASFYTSEFLRFRVGYEHRDYRDAKDLDTLWLQFTFIFGSHPVEPYWFNK